jgi:hypothetical protein
VGVICLPEGDRVDTRSPSGNRPKTPRLVAAILVIMGGATAALAQSETPPYGLVAGFARHRLTSSVASETFHAEPGFAGGFYLRNARSRRVGFGVELLVATRGVVSDFSAVHNYGYWVLDVPFVLEYRTTTAPSRFVPYVLGGLAPGFRLSSVEVKRPDGSDVILVGDRNRIDLTAIAGGGLWFGRVGVEVRYARGLRSLISSGPFAGELRSRSLNVLGRLALHGHER